MEMDKIGMEKLGDYNYPTWKIQMKSILLNKKQWAVVRDGPPAAAAGDAAASGVAPPVQTDSEEALGTMCLYVGKQYLRMVADCPTAKAAWDMLAERHASQSLSRQLFLKQELRQISKSTGETVGQYVARVLELRGALADAGKPVDEEDLISVMIEGLPTEYFQFVTMLKYRGPALTLHGVLSDLQQFEQDLSRRGGGKPALGQAAKAYAANGPGDGNRPPFRGRGGRQQQQGGGGGRGSRADLQCHYCKKLGHFKSECHKLKEDLAKGAGPSGGPAAAYTSTVDKTSHGKSAGVWLLDSGATNHMTGDSTLLSDFTPINHPVHSYGGSVAATGKGNAMIHTAEAPEGILLRDVLYVPGAPANLFSTHKLDKAGSTMVQYGGAMTITHNGRKIATAPCGPDGLYRLTSTKAGAAAFYSKPAETAELWHRRFGHLGYDNLAKLASCGMVTGMNVAAGEFSEANTSVCEPCIMAKQHREPFTKSDSKSTRPLQLVHMYVCGPMPAPSLGGSRYFATYLDDFSRLSLVQPIERKSDVTALTRDVLRLWETQSGHTVQSVRTDGGGEYINNKLEEFFSSKGIQHQKTVPYTPQQNGAAERLNRTLNERVRAMLEDSQLPDELWAEAATTACYIRNRSPVSGESKTPWQLFHGSKPDVKMLRTFGATAYAHVPAQLRKKLDNKSQRGIMVGYAPDTKGYRILLEDASITVSRDVMFDEGSSPATADLTPQASNKKATAEEAAAEAATASDAEAQEAVGAGSSEGPPEPPASGKPAQRRSTREHRQPGEWYKAQANLAVADVKEPSTYEEALASEHSKEWRAAMDAEIASLAVNNTWELEERPSGAKVIPVKWVFKIKGNTTGEVERFKARLVVKGYMQREGVDYGEVYAPVSKHTSLRAILSITAADDLELHSMDIKTAFLNGKLEPGTYVDQPLGYHEGGPNTVAHLHRSLYGLHQAPRAWHLCLTEELKDMGFKTATADPSLFTYQHMTGQILLLVYVDDLLIAASSKDAIAYVKDKIQAAFDTRDLGEATSFLGMSIERDRANRTIKLAQSNMVADLQDRYGLKDAQQKSTPLSPSVQLDITGGEPLDTSVFPYRALVGSLLYISVCTRPDISYSVGALGKYNDKPSTAHWTAAKNVLRYLKGTAKRGINFGGGSNIILGYSDADFAGDKTTRRSTTGYVFLLNGGAICWCSRRQRSVTTSTTEAEYVAQGLATKEALWLRKLLRDLGKDVPTIKIMADNQSAIKLANNLGTSDRSKHIDVQIHFVRERVADKEVEFEYISSKEMVADALTKALPEIPFSFCRDNMGVR